MAGSRFPAYRNYVSKANNLEEANCAALNKSNKLIEVDAQAYINARVAQEVAKIEKSIPSGIIYARLMAVGVILMLCGGAYNIYINDRQIDEIRAASDRNIKEIHAASDRKMEEIHAASDRNMEELQLPGTLRWTWTFP
ncbi:hypothetical protein HOY80DRAFT_1137116 [Tuber brumale]|nr:hypothetical protein HOY80DRAFT_1137116 [Tuber brumale]